MGFRSIRQPDEETEILPSGTIRRICQLLAKLCADVKIHSLGGHEK